MDTKEIKKQIIELERKINVKFPDLYVDFLSKINDGDTFEIKNTGICMYSYSDLEERNETYQVYEFEPKYFMIGQDGDLASLFLETILTITQYTQMILAH